MRYLTVSILLLTLGGCSWFNDVGEHMPVIGDRCEYWQCFTTYGQQQSDAIKQARAQKASGQAPQGQRPAENPPADASASPPPAPQSAAPSHVEFIDPATAPPVDLSSAPPPIR